MSFNLEACYGFGSGSNFTDYEVESGQVFDNFNSYARITAIRANLLTSDKEGAYLGQFGRFNAGETLLIHASTSSNGSTAKLGKFICAKIEVANAGNLTLDKDISSTFDASDLANYNLQAVTFAEFHCLKIYGAILPQTYSSTALHGGILAIKVSDILRVEGVIDLTDKGISTYQKDYLRPLIDQEITGELDSSADAGKENICNNNIFPLNSGDGAAFIFAKTIISKPSARIGNPSTHGKINCRGAADSIFKPSNVTNVGGSSILLICKNENISTTNLAKYRTTFSSDAKKGKGLARCYIATDTELKFAPSTKEHDNNKLYYADLIEDKSRLSRNHKLRNFGRGLLGNVENPKVRLNTLSNITPIDEKVALMTKKLSNGWANVTAGARAIILSEYPQVTTLTNIDGDLYYFAENLPTEAENYLQVTVPEFEKLTLTQEFSDEVFAAMVKDKCKITGKIQSQLTFIFAKELEVGEGAWLGEVVFICAESVTGDLEKCVGTDGLYFCCRWVDG